MVAVASAKGGVASAVAAVLQDVEMGVPWWRILSSLLKLDWSSVLHVEAHGACVSFRPSSRQTT